jgi:Tfp pilus assembly protein PilF
MGNYDLAEKYFKSALQIDPKLLRAYLKLAELYEETNRLDDSIAQFRKIFRIEPGIIVRQPTLGEKYQYINILTIFIQEINEQLQNNPDDPQNNLILAKVYHEQGQYGKSANLLRKVLSKNPGNREAKKLLAGLEKE